MCYIYLTDCGSVLCVYFAIRQGLSKNAIRWIGTEAGRAPDPNWSTGESGGGDPNSPVWCPAECTYCLLAHLLGYSLIGLCMYL